MEDLSKLPFPIILGAQCRRAGNKVAAYQGARLVNFTGKYRAVPIEVNTVPYFYPKPVNDPVAGPHDVVFSQPGDNIMASFFFPSLNIFRSDVGNHIHAAAVAAPLAGNAFIFPTIHDVIVLKLPYITSLMCYRKVDPEYIRIVSIVEAFILR